MPKHELGVDVEKSFEPKYVIPQKAKKVISTIKEAIDKAANIYMATDYDREGEAIAFHLVYALGGKFRNSKPTSSVGEFEIRKLPVRRITFHEITKEAIQESIKHPRQIDLDLVNAQQARKKY